MSDEYPTRKQLEIMIDLASKQLIINRKYEDALESSRDAWKKLAELLETMVDTSACCGMRALGFPEHNTDCPIEQLRKLKEGEG